MQMLLQKYDALRVIPRETRKGKTKGVAHDQEIENAWKADAKKISELFLEHGDTQIGLDILQTDEYVVFSAAQGNSYHFRTAFAAFDTLSREAESKLLKKTKESSSSRLTELVRFPALPDTSEISVYSDVEGVSTQDIELFGDVDLCEEI